MHTIKSINLCDLTSPRFNCSITALLDVTYKKKVTSGAEREVRTVELTTEQFVLQSYTELSRGKSSLDVTPAQGRNIC